MGLPPLLALRVESAKKPLFVAATTKDADDLSSSVSFICLLLSTALLGSNFDGGFVMEIRKLAKAFLKRKSN